MSLTFSDLLLAIDFRAIRDFFNDGGIFMYALAVTSLVALAAIVFKCLSLRRELVIPSKLESELEASAERGTLNESGDGLKDSGSTLGRLCDVALKYRGKPRADISEAVQASARDEIVHLNAGMTILDIIITVAPLFGLLGTASGLVVIFQGLGDNTDYVVVGKGIARALDNTIVGISIAAPAVIAHGWFSRRIEVLVSRLEVLLERFARVCENSPPPIASPSTPRIPARP